MASDDHDKVKQKTKPGKEEMHPHRGVVFSFIEDKDGISAGSLDEMLEWRMGLLSGYCSETNKPHTPEDFEDPGLGHSINPLSRIGCRRCDISVSLEDYHRMEELARLRRGAESKLRSLEISLETSERETGGK